MNARAFLYNNLKSENEDYFGFTDEKWLSYVCDAWMNDESNSAHRYDTMMSIIGDKKLKKSRILDMSSGCGTFVFYGLLNGYDVYGVEPAQWKHQFNLMKAREKGYPPSWTRRYCYGVGENLPFADVTFDVISTYQTLEHVQSHKNCFKEFNRVLKGGGGYLFIQCPDYWSFFEGHYRIPMLPLMNRSLFEIYLKILKKPSKGLGTINYVTKKTIYRLIDNDFDIYDITLNQIKSSIYNKIKINSKKLARAYSTYSEIKNIFRRENSINLVAIKK
jgi:ubiquinone/menaquinone biosynthesis C-methylase UbiE